MKEGRDQAGLACLQLGRVLCAAGPQVPHEKKNMQEEEEAEEEETEEWRICEDTCV